MLLLFAFGVHEPAHVWWLHPEPGRWSNASQWSGETCTANSLDVCAQGGGWPTVEEWVRTQQARLKVEVVQAGDGEIEVMVSGERSRDRSRALSSHRTRARAPGSPRFDRSNRSAVLLHLLTIFFR